MVALGAPAAALASGDGGTPHLPSLVGMLFGTEGAAHHWINIIYGLATSVVMCSVSFAVYRKRTMIPGPLQNFLEVLIEGMYNFIKSILGKDARRYIPFLGTLFFYILINNMWGIIPLGHSPSTSINITASLAILVFLYAQYTGIRRLGIIGYIDHLAGQPRDVISWCLVVLMFPMHIIGEIAKPFSLALRLFGNITGEDVLVAAFVGLGISALAFVDSPIGLPLNVPFIALGILLSTIQALVFTLLSSIYILMMLPHEEGH
jgi:F-type H+-transporting ATPase subunit a